MGGVFLSFDDYFIDAKTVSGYKQVTKQKAKLYNKEKKKEEEVDAYSMSIYFDGNRIDLIFLELDEAEVLQTKVIDYIRKNNTII